ncbi:hypothetical protein [Archaeoglobus sp.]
MLTRTSQDSNGQGVILFLLITASLMIMLYFTISSLGETLEIFGAKSSIYRGFSDVANSIANDIVTIVIFLPHGSRIIYNKTIPTEIGGVTYTITYEDENVTVKVLSGYPEIAGYYQTVHLSGLRWEVNESAITIKNTSAETVVIDVRRK